MSQEFEIIVVDNNSTDGSRDMLKGIHSGITCLFNDENVGFSRANNQGVAKAKGEYLLILNPDTILDESTLADLLEFSCNAVDFGAAGVQFTDGSGKYLPESKRNFPGIKVAGAKLLGYSGNYYANHIAVDAVAEVDILTGAFMFIKKQVYQKVGGFDEDFFMYGEDIDLSYRIRQAGFKNYYIGSQTVLHFKGESTVKDKVYLKNFYGALSIFYKKHFQHSRLFYRLIDFLIEGIIFVKSPGAPPLETRPQKFDSWAFLGDNDMLCKRIGSLYPRAKRINGNEVNEKFSLAEIIFIDSKSLTYKQIIETIKNPLLAKSKKRIISFDQQFYFGSDLSSEKGEIVMF